MLEKPASVANDPFKSAKWDELAEGSGLTQADAPALGAFAQLPYGGDVGSEFDNCEIVESANIVTERLPE